MYDLKLDRPTSSIHTIYGSSLHKALEIYNAYDGDKVDMFCSFDEEWHKLLATLDGKQFLGDKLYTMGLNTIETFWNSPKRKDMKPAIDKAGKKIIEYYFEIPINEKYSVNGIIDLIAHNKKDLWIIDYKTAKEPYSSFKVKTDIQTILYSYAFRELIKQGKIELNKDKEDAICFVLFTKDYDNYTGDIHFHKRKVEEWEYEKMLFIIQGFINTIENKAYIPNYSDEGCKWCPYKKECVEFRPSLYLKENS